LRFPGQPLQIPIVGLQLGRRSESRHHLPNVKFQVGVPTGLDLTFTMLSAVDAFRYADAFSTVVAREVNAVVEEAADDVVIQVEVPGELAFAYKLPGFLMNGWPRTHRLLYVHYPFAEAQTPPPGEPAQDGRSAAGSLGPPRVVARTDRLFLSRSASSLYI